MDDTKYIITKLEIQKKNKEKINIFVNEKYLFSISSNTLCEKGIYNGMELSLTQIEEFKKDDAPKLAFFTIINILSFGCKTTSEIRKKLKEKEFPEEAIESAISKAIEYKYLDDDNYIEFYIKNRAIPSAWGENKILQNLMLKGLEKNKIKQKITEFYDDDLKFEKAFLVAEKKNKTLEKYDLNIKKHKLYSFLLQKGYSYEIVSKVLNKLYSE